MQVSTHGEHHSILETVHHAIDGTDEPMEDEHPLATGALMMGAYPLALFLAIAIAIAFFAFAKVNDDGMPVFPTKAASVSNP